MTVRPMREEDFPAAAALEKACFSRPWSESALRATAEGEGSLFFAAVEGETAVGYVGSLRAGEDREITNVAVDPAFRRRGAGRMLMAAVLAAAAENGEERVLLEVRASNGAARALYASLGFVVDGVRARYYRDPTEDAVLMSVPALPVLR